MSELSNALRQRLASREEPRVHPDADTLTAYREQLLSGVERTQVVEHLAGCRQCREVLALSLPEPAVAEDRAAQALPARRGWRAGRSWGLAASLAGLAIVATVIIELPPGSTPKQAERPAPVSSAAHSTPAPAPAQPAPPPPAVTRGAETRAGFASTKPQSVPPVETAETRITFAAPKAPTPEAGAPYVNVQMFSKEAVAPAVDLPSAPSPHAVGDREQNGLMVVGGTTQLTAGADVPHQTQSGKPLRIFTPPASSSHVFGLSTLTALGRDAKQLFKRPAPAIRSNTFSTSAMGGPGQFNPGKQLGPSPEVTAAAPLAGKDVGELDQSHAFTAAALAGGAGAKMEGASVESRTRITAAAPAAWKIRDNKLLKLGDSGWAEGYPASDGIEFSVVSSHGSEIWAGGSNAALVHSRDGGATWERITLGASATGTITAIEAAGGAKVLVRSSSGQSWSSPDGGKTWVLQD